MKPRDSIPTTTSMSRLPIFSSRPSMANWKLFPSLSKVVMSLNRIPGFGKSGMSRMRAARSCEVVATAESLAPRRRVRDVRAFEEPLDATAFAVGHDHRDIRVRRGGAVELWQDAEEVRSEDARDPTMTDDEHGPAGGLAMDHLQRAQRTLQDLFEVLAVRPLHEAVVLPLRKAAHLVERRPGAIAHIDLDEIAHDVDRHPP